MTSFTFSHAEADDWAGLAKSLADGLKTGAGNGGGDRLGFIYVTDMMADELGSILTYLRQTTGVENWVGSVGIGICASGVEYFDRPAAAAMIGDLPKDSFCVFPAVTDPDQGISSSVRTWAEEASPPFAIVHGDPTTSNFIAAGDGDESGVNTGLAVIDFGLGAATDDDEQRATDLRVLLESLEAHHPELAAREPLLAAYGVWDGAAGVLERLVALEQRGRYNLVRG